MYTVYTNVMYVLISTVCVCLTVCMFCFDGAGDNRYLPAFPARRSSDPRNHRASRVWAVSQLDPVAGSRANPAPVSWQCVAGDVDRPGPRPSVIGTTAQQHPLVVLGKRQPDRARSEEHTSELQSQ